MAWMLRVFESHVTARGAEQPLRHGHAHATRCFAPADHARLPILPVHFSTTSLFSRAVDLLDGRYLGLDTGPLRAPPDVLHPALMVKCCWRRATQEMHGRWPGSLAASPHARRWASVQLGTLRFATPRPSHCTLRKPDIRSLDGRPARPAALQLPQSGTTEGTMQLGKHYRTCLTSHLSASNAYAVASVALASSARGAAYRAAAAALRATFGS